MLGDRESSLAWTLNGKTLSQEKRDCKESLAFDPGRTSQVAGPHPAMEESDGT